MSGVNAQIVEGMFSPEAVARRREETLAAGAAPSREVNAYPQPVSITLGTQTFTIGPLKLRFLRELDACAAAYSAKFATLAPEQQSDAYYDRMVQKVTAALKSNDPDFTGDLLDMEMTPQQLMAASRAVDILTGLVPQGEAAGSASTGGTSTD